MEPNDSGTGVIVFGDGRELQLANDLADFGIATVLITTAAVEDKDNLAVIRTPSASNGVAAAILAALPTQIIMQDLAEAAGLPACEFRYRQVDTKLPVPEKA
jgi:glucosamine--fructose-6-phosphate aminotransferase (isomerizing)